MADELGGSNMEMDAAEKLCKVSWDKWISEEHGTVVDDITAIVARLWDVDRVSRRTTPGAGLDDERGVSTRSRRQSRTHRETA